MRNSPRPPLLVTQYYWPELIGSGPYCDDIAAWLCGDAGDAVVFTCRPHYPDGRVPPAFRSGSRDRERRGRCAVERVNPWRPQQRGAAGRIVAEAVFLLNGIAALAVGRLRRSDVVVSLCPSILTVLLGVLATRRKGTHVAVVHDIQSGLASNLGMVGSSPLVKAMQWAERIVLNRVDTVLVLSEEMRRCLESQGIRTRIDVLPLWVDTGVTRPAEQPGGNRATVLYSGNFGRKQALGQIVEMAELLQRRNVNVSVVLRGQGTEAGKLAAEVADRGLENVRFEPLVPPERFAEALAEGDIHVVPQSEGTADYAVPSKIFAIMAAARPFVATARPGSLLWRLMDDSRAFVCVPAGDAVALADAVQRLALDPELGRDLGRNGRRYVVANHCKDIVREKFLGIVRGHTGRQVDHDGCAAASSCP